MVVLDATIVNVALPHIQRALGFSGNSLAWVITAYALASEACVAGRMNRRPAGPPPSLRVRVTAVLGRLVCRRLRHLPIVAAGGPGLQGAGAVLRPTALALVATNSPKGRPATGQWEWLPLMSGAGAAVGLVAGGLLTTYLSWRWVLFVTRPSVWWRPPAAPMVLAESPRRRGRFDLAGRSPAPSEWPCWSMASQTPAPISTAYPTGVTTRSWPPWWRRRSFVGYVLIEPQPVHAHAAADFRRPQPLRCLSHHAGRRHRHVGISSS